jgi:hypothetical protein
MSTFEVHLYCANLSLNSQKLSRLLCGLQGSDDSLQCGSSCPPDVFSGILPDQHHANSLLDCMLSICSYTSTVLSISVGKTLMVSSFNRATFEPSKLHALYLQYSATSFA